MVFLFLLLLNRVAAVDPSWMLVYFSPFADDAGQLAVLRQKAAEKRWFLLA